MNNQKKTTSSEHQKISQVREPIAIVGIGCRFPGARSPAQLWSALLSGQDLITEVPPDRYDIEQWYNPDPKTPGKIATRMAGLLKRSVILTHLSSAFRRVRPSA